MGNLRTSRFASFSVVGFCGFVGQTCLLAWLTRSLEWSAAVALPITAEAALLLNFSLHSCWTWADRPMQGPPDRMVRLVRYQLARIASMAISYGLTLLMVTSLRLPPELANALAVGALAVANFLLADKVIFRSPATSALRGSLMNGEMR